MSLEANHALAFGYASFGVRVFPCREINTTVGKAKAPYIRNGYHAASVERHTLALWSALYPEAIYGLPCAPNGLFVLDADRHGGSDGVQSLMTLFAHYNFDQSAIPIVHTPRGGLHVLFSRPCELGRTKGSIASAIDVRDAGYIIAPGTILPDGRGYCLTNGSMQQLAAAIANRTLLPPPSWLIDLVTPSIKAAHSRLAPLHRAGSRRQLDGIVARVRKAAMGERNSVLHWAACRYGELVSAGRITAQDAESLLYEAGISAGLDAREARNTIASGMRKGMAERRHGR